MNNPGFAHGFPDPPSGGIKDFQLATGETKCQATASNINISIGKAFAVCVGDIPCVIARVLDNEGMF
jgi:hypothetical protein